jgi:hypothetical protein
LSAVTKRTFDPDPARRAAAVIGDALERRVRATGVRPLIQIDQDEWPVAAGALLHLQRSRLAFAVEDDWLVMFTERARSTGAEGRTDHDHWTTAPLPADQSPGRRDDRCRRSILCSRAHVKAAPVTFDSIRRGRCRLRVLRS